MAKEKDQFAQLAYFNLQESAANTLTFGGLTIVSNVLSQRAMVIHRVQYVMVTAVWALLTAGQDGMLFGLAGDDTISDAVNSDPSVYDYNKVLQKNYGTPASAELVYEPIEKDYTGMPGGGLLVPADRLFAFIQGISLASATQMEVRVWFTLQDLSAAEYLELAQAMRVLR